MRTRDLLGAPSLRREFFHFRRVVTLADGSQVVVRALRREDREGLRAGILSLSPESRYRRFMMHSASEPTESFLDRLVAVDGERHLALVAIVESLDLKEERGVGVARYVTLPGAPHVAEAAVTVVDAMQRKGVGKALLEPLAELAVARGIQNFRAEVLRENEGVRRILDASGATLVREEGDVLVYDVPLDGEGPQSTRNLVELLGEAARSVTVALRRFLPENASDDEAQGGGDAGKTGA